MQLIEKPNGFDIVNPLLNKTATFECKDGQFYINGVAESNHIQTHDYIKKLITKAMDGYKARGLKPLATKSKEWSRGNAIFASVIKKSSKCLAKKIATQVTRLQALCDSNWLAIERKVFSTVGPKNFERVMLRIRAKLVSFPEEEKTFFLKDLSKYRALIYQLASFDHFVYQPNWIEHNTFNSNVYVKQTFADLPGGLRSDFAPNIFKNKNFPKKLSFIELRYFLVSHKFYPEKDIRSACKLYCVAVNQKLDFRKRNLYTLMQNYASDYPEEHKGSLTGLLRKSIRWHRSEAYRRIAGKFADVTPAAKPPQFILDAIEKQKGCIKFLDSVQNIKDEGVLMHHCIAGYADRAVEGKCFLFHIEYKGEKASVELKNAHLYSSNGPTNKLVLSQARGPHNRQNKATKWAEKFFNKILCKEYGVHSEPKINTQNLVLANNEIPF